MRKVTIFTLFSAFDYNFFSFVVLLYYRLESVSERVASDQFLPEGKKLVKLSRTIRPAGSSDLGRGLPSDRKAILPR